MDVSCEVRERLEKAAILDVPFLGEFMHSRAVISRIAPQGGTRESVGDTQDRGAHEQAHGRRDTRGTRETTG